MGQFLKKWSLVILLICFFLDISVYCRESSVFFDKTALESKNCTFTPKTAESNILLEKYISDRIHLIRMNVTVHWNNLTAKKDSYPRNMEWYMTTSISGKRLLLLDKNFEMMSLWTLSQSVVTMSLRLEQGPSDCLRAYSPDKADDIIYYSLLKIPNSNKTANDDENKDHDLEICNGYSKEPVCCRITRHGKLKCDKHLTDKRVKILERAISIILFLSLSFSLNLVPRSWYETNNSVFEFMEPVEQATFIDAKRAKHNKIDLKNFKRTRKPKRLQDIFEEIPESETNKMFCIRVGVKKVFAQTDQLVSEITKSPGLKYFFSHLMVFLSYFCFTCRMRNIDLLKCHCYKETCCKLYFYQCLGKIMKIIVSLLYLLPLLLQCLYKFHYDYDKIEAWLFFTIIVLISVILIAFQTFQLKGFKAVLRECLSLTYNQDMAKRFKSSKNFFFAKCLDDSVPWYLCCFKTLWSSLLCIICICISFFPFFHFLLMLFRKLSLVNKSLKKRLHRIFLPIIQIIFFLLIIIIISMYILV